MKALIFSDIHGNIQAAETIDLMARQHQPDVIFLLGDLLYHGPRNPLPAKYDPQGVAEILNKIPSTILAVSGNCDSHVDKNILNFPVSPEFFSAFLEGVQFFCSHGHIYSLENLPPLKKGSVFLYGHTHIPMAESMDSIYICNPGSLTFPKDGHPKSFGLFDQGIFSVIAENGDVYLQLTCC